MTNGIRKFLGIGCAVVLAMLLAACGGSSHSQANINGNWTATLINGDGSPAFAFTMSLTQAGGTNVNITNFNFTTSGSCFGSNPVNETGSFTLSGNFNGQVSGAFAMVISATNEPSDVLTLQGTVNNGVITGTWTLTGTGSCTGNGTFTMTRM